MALALRPVQQGQRGDIVERPRHVGVIPTKGQLLDPQGALQQRYGLVKVTLARVGRGQVVECLGDIGASVLEEFLDQVAGDVIVLPRFLTVAFGQTAHGIPGQRLKEFADDAVFEVEGVQNLLVEWFSLAVVAL